MKFLWLRVVLLLFGLLIVSGCSLPAKLGGVVVTLTDYRPAAVDTQATLALHFRNENVFPIAIADTAGKLYLNGAYVGHFATKEAMGIPQLSTTDRNATLIIENSGYLQQLRTSATEAISYRMEISIHVELGEDKKKINAAFTGQIDRASLNAKPATEPKH